MVKNVLVPATRLEWGWFPNQFLDKVIQAHWRKKCPTLLCSGDHGEVGNAQGIHQWRGEALKMPLACLTGTMIGRDLQIPKLGGPQEKMSFFQIASGPILSIPIYLKTWLYGPCKFSLKKNDQNLPTGHVKVLIFCCSSR